MNKLATFFASLLIGTVGLRCQTLPIGLEIDYEPPGGLDADDPNLGSWWNPETEPAPSLHTTRIRIRLHGPAGAWMRPLVDFDIDRGALGTGDTWLADNPWLETDPSSASTVDELRDALANSLLGTPDVHPDCLDVMVEKPASLLRWVDFVARNGLPYAGPTGAWEWSQPVLTTPNAQPLPRLWTTSPPLWQAGNGPISSTIWQGMSSRKADGTSTFDFFACLRYALLEHAIFTTGSPQPAVDFINTADWNSLLNSDAIRLVLRVFGLLAQPLSEDPVIGDGDAPDLFSPDMPMTYVSPGWTFHVELPEPHLTPFHDLSGDVLVPGTLHRFHSAAARHPVICRFPVIQDGVYGLVNVQAVAVPTLMDPTTYAVQVPAGLTAGPLRVKHGGSAWIDLDPVPL